MSRTMLLVAFVGSSPCFTMMTFFSHLAHHRSPFFSLKSGDAHAGQASSVRVVPWRRRFAMRFMCGSWVCFLDKF